MVTTILSDRAHRFKMCETYDTSSGAVACASHSQAPFGGATGINDIIVGGDLFDVTFTETAPVTSPFVLSSTTATPGQPLTGIDAGSAIATFYGTLLPPYGSYAIGGDQGPAFITAFGPAGSLSSEFTPFGDQPVTELYDIIQTNVGADYGNNVAEAGNDDFREAGDGVSAVGQGGGPFFTTWTPIAAPEVDSRFAGSGLTLLIGGLAMLQGRRRQ